MKRPEGDEPGDRGPDGMRIGVFGGAFDPLHIAHLIVADDVAAALDLDRVLFIPSGTHPLKGSGVRAPPEQRLEMVRAATAANERFVADERELRRAGPSYTVDTLVELREENPGATLFLLLGADILGELDEWHRAADLARFSRVVVMSRPEVEIAGPAVELEYERVDVTHVEISSTEVRRRVAAGEPYRYLVPEAVRRIIRERSLYKQSA